jgi:hypothetical protein
MMETATARDYLREVARSTDDFTTKWVIDGIFWADESCRICGTLSLALRDADAESGRKLIQHLLDSGVTTQAEVPRFLNQYFHTCLNILSPTVI